MTRPISAMLLVVASGIFGIWCVRDLLQKWYSKARRLPFEQSASNAMHADSVEIARDCSQ